MTPPQLALLRHLAHGDFVSGEALGAVTGVSRAAVWKQLQQLEAQGLRIESVKGRGYRIVGGLDLLDKQAIIAALSPASRACLAELDLAAVVDSTSSCLLRRLTSGSAVAGMACIAEQQTGGRGRRGRQWVSPFARNLYCSLLWEFEQGIAALEGLSLAVGVATVTALEHLGFRGITLKWPNDLLWQGRKLGGVLLELSGEASGTCQVVVGIGLNVDMPAAVAGGIDQPWVDLTEIAANAEQMPSRSRLTAILLDELVGMLCRFQRDGFTTFRPAWEARNAHQDRDVVLIMPGKQVGGRVMGITDKGGLRLAVNGEEQIFLGGEISLRSQA